MDNVSKVNIKEGQIKQYLSWKEAEKDCELLAEKIKKYCQEKYKIKNPDYIYGISRGGLPLATILSHMLDVKMIHSRDSIDKEDAIVCIVDDISDSGDTLEKKVDKYYHCDKVKDIVSVTWMIKEDTSYKPNLFEIVVDKKIWVCFPWEKK